MLKVSRETVYKLIGLFPVISVFDHRMVDQRDQFTMAVLTWKPKRIRIIIKHVMLLLVMRIPGKLGTPCGMLLV